MFKLRKVSSHINYQPAAVLDGALKSNDICKLFSTPGHLFMQRGSQLQVFDAFPADLKSSTLCKPFTFFLSGTSPVIHIHVLQTNWNIAFMVHEDGDVEIWKHIQGSHSWSKVHQVCICNTKDALVTKVLILEEHKKILWLEKNPGGEDDCCYTVNARSFSNDGDSITNIGPVDVLLSNCPDVDFFEIHNRVYIWPSHTCPPGLYFVWYINKLRDNCLKTLILGRKFEENIQETSADFKLLARNLIHVWSQVEGCLITAKIVNEVNKELLVVHSDGEVDILCEDNKISRRISLKGYQHCEKESLHVFRSRLFAVEQTRIRIFCMKSGNITQEIDLHSLSDTEIHTWSGFGPVPSVGVWSSKGLWELQMTEVDKLQDRQQLEEFGQDRLASNAVLKQLLFTEKSGDMKTTSTTELLKPEMFQNPAILLALLQQTKEGSKPNSVVDEQERLCSLFSGNKLDCDLSESMDSLLSQFKHLNTQYSQLMSFQPENAVSPSSFLYDEVLFLIQDSTVHSIDYRYSQMEVLAQHFPCKVLDILLRYLHIGRFANGQE
ncbi:uncharacterized protein LOC117108923 [Anneissia japonica]|uniref:uncharacterized protein LOC117108923 n=1 Tax=Anneissia japonica TaxID=1529436 RepID=UPI0014255D8B|nr:uncharacterized protein LOC117108923 [Anneissia japonica]